MGLTLVMAKNQRETVSSPVSQSDKVEGYQGIELIYYGQMSLVKDADELLASFGYGRAHFRAMYVISIYPHITGNELLTRLKITNQSLSRVMRQLLADGMVRQESSMEDRRLRRHILSGKGAALFQKAADLQFEVIFKAYEAAGKLAVSGFLQVLQQLMPMEDRHLLTFPINEEP